MSIRRERGIQFQPYGYPFHEASRTQKRGSPEQVQQVPAEPQEQKWREKTRRCSGTPAPRHQYGARRWSDEVGPSQASGGGSSSTEPVGIVRCSRVVYLFCGYGTMRYNHPCPVPIKRSFSYPRLLKETRCRNGYVNLRRRLVHTWGIHGSVPRRGYNLYTRPFHGGGVLRKQAYRKISHLRATLGNSSSMIALFGTNGGALFPRVRRI